MNIPSECDVILIGGGPSGSLAATYMAQIGYRAVLLEKQVHPRYMVGESLIPLFWKFTDAAGVTEKIEAEGFVQKAGGTVSWMGEIHSHTFKDVGYNRPALHVERDRFDHILLENAREKGAEVFEGTAVTGVNFSDPEAPVVSYRADGKGASGKIACRYVVDASGQSAVLGRQLGIRTVDEGFRYMSVWGYFTGARYLAFGGKAYRPEEMPSHPPTTFVTSLKEFGDIGWAWHIALRESTSVGFVLPVAALKKERKSDEDWEAFFMRRCEATGGIRELLQGAAFVPGSVRLIRNYSYQSEKLAGPGYFLAGDAAGFVDPIFSVGVVMAMYSAYAATWALTECLKQPESASRYRKIYEHQMCSRIEVARALALPSYQPGQEVDEIVRSSIHFDSGRAKDLMNVVTRLTSRTDNFQSMVAGEPDRELPPNAYVKVDILEFD